ncbi:energy transducer TonB [Sphingomonas sp. MMS12-HWE2-04]|uniref:energy transducer TonB n=1 Tax=Sphingomonas sp. MMS12-HWE2-04 TaxID=3234199 RepID=UPI00384E0F1C
MKHWRLALALAATFPTAAMADTAPEVLQRTGRWMLDYDRDSCRMVGQFGTGDDQMLLRITRFDLSDTFDLAVFGNRVASDHLQVEATVSFGLDGKPEPRKGLAGTTGKMKTVWFNSMRFDGAQLRSYKDPPLPKVTAESEAAVTGVTVEMRGKKPFRLEFGSLAKPMAQMRVCQEDLIKSWGYDAVVQANLREPPKPIDPERWLQVDDFPMEALRQSQSGMVQFRLDVDDQGKAGGCYVLGRTSPDLFADTTCKAVLQRARYRPAIDAEGHPVRSFAVRKVVWQIPE